MRPKRTMEQLQFDVIRNNWWENDGPTLRIMAQDLEVLATKLQPTDYRHKILAHIRAAEKGLGC